MKQINIIKVWLFASTAIVIFSCNQPTSADKPSVPDSETGSVVTAAPNEAKPIPSGPVEGTRMTDAYVKQVAQMAYLWGWPMINVHNRKTMYEKLPHAGLIGGIVMAAPPNQLAMLTDYVVPEERIVACPNQDVVYGMGLMNFDKEPALIVQVPDFGDRFWVYQVCDQRTDGFAEIGKMYGSKPGFYLLTGPNWDGKTPDGIQKVFKCATSLGLIIPRAFQSDDVADKQALQPTLTQIMMYPVSQFDGKMKTADWKALPTFPSASSGGEETKWVDPNSFFDVLPEILKEVPAMAGEEALYAQMQSVLDASAKDPKIKAVLKAAAIEYEASLIKPLFQFVNVGYPVQYNWTTQKNGASFGTDYLTRTAVAKSNIFVNKPAETKYFYQDLDEKGIRLNGKNNYTVTYAAGQLPPVKGFWSLTLYNENHFFENNKINRYSLGTKNKGLQKNADGSVTIYVQKIAPSADKMSNWLPSPASNFTLYQRCYWPEETILNGTWNPPAIVKQVK